MKIIFSRKGFDSQYGGIPSPILNKSLISLPIPDQTGALTYKDLGLDSFVCDLSKNRIKGHNRCHNDPDLITGAFGQAGAALGHLNNQGVEPGDVFLFFGSFRHVVKKQGKYVWRPDTKSQHRLFGWLFIDEIFDNLTSPLELERLPEKYKSHAHLSGKWPTNNTIFTAPKKINLFGSTSVSGFGKFYATHQTLLTHPESSKKSFWFVPSWLNPIFDGCGLSYHSPKQFSNSGLQTTAKGQEFIAHPSEDSRFKDWLISLFNSSSSIA